MSYYDELIFIDWHLDQQSLLIHSLRVHMLCPLAVFSAGLWLDLDLCTVANLHNIIALMILAKINQL